MGVKAVSPVLQLRNGSYFILNLKPTILHSINLNTKSQSFKYFRNFVYWTVYS